VGCSIGFPGGDTALVAGESATKAARLGWVIKGEGQAGGARAPPPRSLRQFAASGALRLLSNGLRVAISAC
jgi:hypothetical protein